LKRQAAYLIIQRHDNVGINADNDSNPCKYEKEVKCQVMSLMKNVMGAREAIKPLVNTSARTIS
jgi:hypothetical protein